MGIDRCLIGVTLHEHIYSRQPFIFVDFFDETQSRLEGEPVANAFPFAGEIIAVSVRDGGFPLLDSGRFRRPLPHDHGADLLRQSRDTQPLSKARQITWPRHWIPC